MKSIEQQRQVEIRPGFSPKPLVVAAPDLGTSPTMEPDSPSPNAQMDGPLIQRANLNPQPARDMTVQDGIVSFGK